MISIQNTDYGLDVAIFNEFTLDDFKAFEQAILTRVKQGDRPSLLIDLTNVLDFTIDMAIEELRFTFEHDSEIGKIAIAVTDTWMNIAAHLAGWFVENTLKYFDNAEEARAWIAEK